MPSPLLAFPAPRIAEDVRPGIGRIHIRDFVVMAQIGVYEHEKLAPQRVRLNLDLEVAEASRDDELRNVVCYDKIVQAVRRLVGAGHIQLVETLGERIADLCLADPRVRRATVTVEKLDIYPDIAAVGITLTRDSPL